MAQGEQAATDECLPPLSVAADAAPPAAHLDLRHQAMRAWDWANEALAADWQFSMEFDRCAHASRGGEAPGGHGNMAARSGPRVSLLVCFFFLSSSAAPYFSTPPPCSYFWRTTLALYSVFTIKTAPQLSRRENLENCIICAAIVGMAAVST